MKKVAIISDIHGNLEALNSVLSDIEKQNVDNIYCLGDVVGYGPYPGKCLKLVREIAHIIVMGNHEEGVIGWGSPTDFNSSALRGLYFSRTQLGDDDIEFIKSLPTYEIVDEYDITLVHGSFVGSNTWSRIFNISDAMRELGAIFTNLCVVGHIHVPLVISSEGEFQHDGIIKKVLDKDKKYLLNVGSVGQPRDKNPKACYGLLTIDRDEKTFEIRRVSYDIEKTANAIIRAKLPVYLAERLFEGR
ncbi:MAG: metallophosphoesterase family protein [Patescibacteria group bacterium]